MAENGIKKCKKWSNEEISSIIDFLEENSKFQHPTAHIFYKKFLFNTKIEATWKMVMLKVRYLKVHYNKAEKWRSGTGAGLTEIDLCDGTNSVQEKLNKICPLYDRLNLLFGQKQETLKEVVHDTADYTLQECLNYVTDELPSPEQLNSDNLPIVNVEQDTPVSRSKSPSSSGINLSRKEKRSATGSAMSALTTIHEERNKVMEKKLS